MRSKTKWGWVPLRGCRLPPSAAASRHTCIPLLCSSCCLLPGATRMPEQLGKDRDALPRPRQVNGRPSVRVRRREHLPDNHISFVPRLLVARSRRHRTPAHRRRCGHGPEQRGDGTRVALQTERGKAEHRVSVDSTRVPVCSDTSRCPPWRYSLRGTTGPVPLLLAAVALQPREESWLGQRYVDWV